MSGICGIFQEKGTVDKNLLHRMMNKMRHRGPDGENYYLESPVGLGANHLKLNAGVTAESQPLSNENGSIWLVCSGQIFNHQELRRSLIFNGHRFQTQNSAEVILHLYEEKKEECVNNLRGMFAFVIWDKQRKTLFGARDRFGIKPLYYWHKNGMFAFASELKALLEIPQFPKKIAEDSFIDYLTFQYVPQPRTIFSGVYQIPPAHYFCKTPLKHPYMKKYWQTVFAPSPGSYSYFREIIKNKMEESVRLHLHYSGPKGAFLSSGIDSAIIAALACSIEPLSTFSVGYEEKNYSELAEAGKTAQYLGVEHHEYIISPEEFIGHLPLLMWHFDEPVADPAAISLYFLARLASKKTRAVLSGEGADELFAGYGIYREPYSLAIINNLPPPVRRSAWQMGNNLPLRFPGKNYLRRCSTPLHRRFLGNAFIFSPEEKAKIISPGLKNLFPFRITDPLYRQTENLDEVTRMQYIDLHTWLPGNIMAKADKMTMANSLELRSPFLDHKLFEIAAIIPEEYKIKDKITKAVLREAFRDMLPRETVYRPKKGFPVPLREWIKRSEFKQALLDLLAGKGGLWFNRNEVYNLYQKHLQGKTDASRKLWTVFIFLLWHNVFHQA